MKLKLSPSNKDTNLEAAAQNRWDLLKEWPQKKMETNVVP